MKFSILVTRREDFRITQAVVVSGEGNEITRKDFPKAITTHDEFQAAVIRAVDEWVNTTIQGKELLEYSREDLNIGDLSSWIDDPDLKVCLAKQGITNFDVHGPDITAWHYDTVLSTVTLEAE